MPLINLQSVTLSYGLPPLLDAVDLAIDRGERVALVGRNGAGKSTLLRLIEGVVQPDDGERRVADGVRIATLPQAVPIGMSGKVVDVVADGLGELGDLVREYHAIGRRLTDASADESLLARLSEVQHELEARGGWEIEQRVERALSQLGLDANAEFTVLSGGLKRRVLLACALVRDPDLLLLDEPTNHLDIDTIAWMEEFLLGFGGSLLFVTHDRLFVRRLATRIVELDRGQLTDWPGDYDNYLRRREERRHAEAVANARFDRKLSDEEVWIRQGIKARRTRNQGRVRELEVMREERRQRRSATGEARIRLSEAQRSGRLVVEAEGVGFDRGDKAIVRDLDVVVMRGDKIGIVGPNGVGKTTLLKLLLGELAPTRGRIRQGTNLEVAYFDQLRVDIDDAKSVQDNVAGGSDKVDVGGRSRHVMSYLKDFLFTADRVRQPAGALSGGERNRLLLAKLFTRPANVLVLDEPTNDLDVETLELLEELIVDFEGTVLLVSHDRALLDAVVTSCLVFEGDGRVGEYVGGYSDWLRQRPVAQPSSGAQTATPKETAAPKPKRSSNKLSYKDKRELEALPERIEALEQEQARLHASLADPKSYQGAGEAIVELKARLETVEAELEASYARWEALEELAGG